MRIVTKHTDTHADTHKKKKRTNTKKMTQILNFTSFHSVLVEIV